MSNNNFEDYLPAFIADEESRPGVRAELKRAIKVGSIVICAECQVLWQSKIEEEISLECWCCGKEPDIDISRNTII